MKFLLFFGNSDLDFPSKSFLNKIAMPFTRKRLTNDRLLLLQLFSLCAHQSNINRVWLILLFN